MATVLYFFVRKVLLLYLVFFLFASVLLCSSSEHQFQSSKLLGRRKLLEAEKEDQPVKKKTSTSLSAKNQTKLIKPSSSSSKNQTKLAKPNLSFSKNQTKIVKSTNNSTKTLSNTKIELKKLNSTSKTKKLNSTSKASNPTKTSTTTTPSSSSSTKKTSDPIKLSSPKNQTTKLTTVTTTKIKQTEANQGKLESEKPNSKNQKTEKKKTASSNTQRPKKQTLPSWIDDEEEDDLVSEFTGLPSKFQKTLLPDLEKISITSKAYLNKYNKEITNGFKPIVGNKYAPTIASFVSFAFIIIPLLLVSLIVNRIKAYFSLQKLLIFIQVYLSIYFAILCLSSLVTGLEPLKFFYATSQSNYICLQVLQTLGYVLYLLLLLMYLILVFSTDCGLGSKLLSLAQTMVGFAIGLHYYVAVFHRVVLHQPPKTNWKIHGIYATCFFLICLCANAERRKKAYLEEGGEEGKKS